MAQVTLPLREEHRELFPHVELFRQVADRVGQVPTSSLRKGVSEVHDFLTRHLIPHATAEDEVLYPAVDRLMGAKGATATMAREHVEVGRLAAELAGILAGLGNNSVSEADERELRRILYGLYATVKLHFAKEEEIYLPLLDERMADDDARAMFERMEAAAARARDHV